MSFLKLHRKLSKKERKELEKKNKLRSDLEVFLDFHNHKMELIRTVIQFIGTVLSTLIALKVFHII